MHTQNQCGEDKDNDDRETAEDSGDKDRERNTGASDRIRLLRRVISEDGRCTKDIKRGIGLASAMFGTMNKLWRSNNITTATKVKLYGTFVIPVMMYGSECWCLRKEDENL